MWSDGDVETSAMRTMVSRDGVISQCFLSHLPDPLAECHGRGSFLM